MINRLLIPSLLITFCFLVPTTVLAKPPKTIFYQGRLTNDTGVPLDGSFNLDFRLYDAASGGSQVWPSSGSESFNNVDVTRGVYSVYLGSNKPLDPADFGETLWLEVDVDGSSFSPRTELSSMPYAFNAYRVGGENLSDLDGRYVDQSGDTMSGNLDMTGNKILLNNGWLSGNGSNDLTITDLGEVGINTGSPIGKTHILGKNVEPALDSAPLVLEEEGDNDKMFLGGDEIDGATGGSAGNESGIYLQNNTTNDVYMVTGGGSVGVNTTSPSAKTHIVGSDVGGGGDATLKLEESGEGDKLELDGDEINGAIGGGAGNESALYIQNTTSNELYLGNGGGFVGVNTSAPDDRFVVDDSGGTDGMKIYSEIDHLSLIETDASNQRWGLEVENGDFFVNEDGAGGRWFTIEDDVGGEIGFHETNPSHRFEVNLESDTAFFNINEGAGEDFLIGSDGGAGGKDVYLVPEADNQGYIGTSGAAWQQINHYGSTNVSLREGKENITSIDPEIMRYLMRDIRNLDLKLFNYNSDDEPSEIIKGVKQRSQYRIGMMARDAPDYISGNNFSGVSLYELASLSMSGVKFNDQKLRSFSDQVRQSSDFGHVDSDTRIVTVRYNSEFQNRINSPGDPVITITPTSPKTDIYIKEKMNYGFRVVNSEGSAFSFDWTAKVKISKLIEQEKLDIPNRIRKKLNTPESKERRIREKILRRRNTPAFQGGRSRLPASEREPEPGPVEKN